MSRLDQHVAAVQNKLTLARFVNALGWTLLIYCLLIKLVIISVRLTPIQYLPHAVALFWVGMCGAVLCALVWAILRRPSRKAAAVAIDEKLGLQSKISTALYMRNSTDAFAQAAVKDAEATAANFVKNVYQYFPLRVSRVIYFTCLAMVVALGTYAWVPNHPLWGNTLPPKQQAEVDSKRAQAQDTVKRALATVESVPKAVANDEAIKKAQIDLQNLLKQPIKDPATANRTALKALQDAQEAIKRQAENNSRFAEAQNTMKDLAKNVTPPTDEKGPIADAQRKLAEGKFTEAFNKLDDVVKKFDQMDEQQKQQAAQQMQQLAKQLQQAAGNPQQQQQQIAKQLQQQLGMNQQQAQNMAQQMQQAAAGDQKAQQQVQQQVQQMMQQMNNGNGPTKSQQQQMQQMMQQMQAQANSQATSGQMAQAAQQMAQAMQQASKGQQGAQQGQQMAQGLGQMQQQLQNMEGAAQDAQQIAAAQQNMQEAAEDAGNNLGQNGQGEDGKLAGREDGANPWAQGNPMNKGVGMGGPGIGAGGRAAKNPSPFAVKPEVDSSPDNQKGKILASNYIKDSHPIAGKSGETLKDVAQATEKEAADEVDNQRMGNQVKSTVKNYFKAMSEDQKQ